MNTTFELLESVEALEAIYDAPGRASLAKETQSLIPEYRRYVEASPFCVIATVGPEGLDCSPRGDRPGFVRIADDRTLMMPDRRGNNRLDSLKNLIRDPRVALLFLVPGHDTCLRVNGHAGITADKDLTESFEIDGKAPRTVLVVETRAVYFQCARALVRSRLWDEDSRVDPASLPTAGEMLAAVSDNEIGGPDYDVEWRNRGLRTLW